MLLERSNESSNNSWKMFSFFSKPAPKPFKPLLIQHPARKPCDCARNSQSQSMFFDKLPAEIRNVIYEYVFTFPSPEYEAFPDLTPHPLSLLLTCHKAHDEACLPAFHHSTFRMNPWDKAIFVELQSRMAHLSMNQINAITSISRCKTPVYHGVETAFFENAMALFPNLKRLELRLVRDKDFFHAPQRQPHWHPLERLDEGVDKYAPSWFVDDVVYAFMKSKAFTWQGKRDQWRIHWPQLEDHGFYDILDDVDEEGDPYTTPFMSPDAVGNVPGVNICPCGCGNIIWTAVDFIHESGRKITVEVIFHGEPAVFMDMDSVTLYRKMFGANAVILKPGVEELQLQEFRSEHSSGDITGLAYEADEAYWDAIRRKNWHLGAMARHWWRSIPSLVKRGDPLPGSFHLGQGDWEWIKAQQKGGQDQVSSTSNVASNANRNSAEGISHGKWISPRADIVEINEPEQMTKMALEAYENQTARW